MIISICLPWIIITLPKMLEYVFHQAKVLSIAVHVGIINKLLTVQTLGDVCCFAGFNVFVVSPVYFLN